MSPSGKAPDFDSGIRRFESCHPSHVGARRALLRFYFFLPDPLAQLAEQLPFKQWVWSSNLQRVTKKQPRGCFFACPMEIRRLAMRQSGGLSLAQPMQDRLHQKHWQFVGLQTALHPRARLQYFCSAKMQANASGSPKSSREAAFLRARWRFEDLQCDSPVDCRSRDRCRIACIKSI